MASAFDWSPGGCCCEPPGGCFDVYGIVQTPNGESASPHPGGLTRYGVMWPDRLETPPTLDLTASGYHAKNRTGWSIPPDVPLANPSGHYSLGTLCGSPEKGDYVWSIEKRSETVAQHVVLYDAAAKRELFAIPTDNTPAIFLNTRRVAFQPYSFVSASDAEFAYGASASNIFRVYSSSGSRDFGYAFQPTQPTPSQGKWSVNLHSPRDWPVVAGTYVTTSAGVYTVQFCYGKADTSGGVVDFSNRTVVHEYQTRTGLFSTTGGSEPAFANQRWRVFDSVSEGGTNCGAFAFYQEDDINNPASPVYAHVMVVANGAVVKTFRSQISSALYGTDSLNGYFLKCIQNIEGTFHASHSGGAFIAKYDFATEPGLTQTGVYADPQRPAVATVHATGELWRSQRVGTVYARLSSDRWFYLRGSQSIGFPERLPSGGWLPNENRTVAGTAGADLWVVKKDGSQASPIGELRYGTTLVSPRRNIVPQGLIAPPQGLTFYDCVKNPSDIDSTLPADASGFEDAVKSSVQ